MWEKNRGEKKGILSGVEKCGPNCLRKVAILLQGIKSGLKYECMAI